MDLKQLFLTRSHDGYLGKEGNVCISKLFLFDIYLINFFFVLL